jgi:hypothetical protein
MDEEPTRLMPETKIQGCPNLRLIQTTEPAGREAAKAKPYY